MSSHSPFRAASAAQPVPILRQRSNEAMRSGSGAGAGAPHNMTASSPPFEDAATLKGDYSGDSTLKGEYPDERSSTDAHHHHKLQRVTSTLQGPRKWMGLQPTAPVAGDEEHAAHVHLGWSKTKLVFKEPFAEFWGTFILVLFGTSRHSQPSCRHTNMSKETLAWLKSPLAEESKQRQAVMALVTGKVSTGLSESASCWESTLQETVAHT